MNKLEKFNETSIPEIEEFFRNLKMLDITYVDYMHTKRVYKDFEIKNVGQYYDFNLKNDALLLVVILKIL